MGISKLMCLLSLLCSCICALFYASRIKYPEMALTAHEQWNLLGRTSSFGPHALLQEVSFWGSESVLKTGITFKTHQRTTVRLMAPVLHRTKMPKQHSSVHCSSDPHPFCCNFFKFPTYLSSDGHEFTSSHNTNTPTLLNLEMSRNNLHDLWIIHIISSIPFAPCTFEILCNRG